MTPDTDPNPKLNPHRQVSLDLLGVIASVEGRNWEQDAVPPVVLPLCGMLAANQSNPEVVGKCTQVLYAIAPCRGAPALIVADESALGGLIAALGQDNADENTLPLICLLAEEAITASVIAQQPTAIRALVNRSREECNSAGAEKLALPCLAGVVSRDATVCDALVNEGILGSLATLMNATALKPAEGSQAAQKLKAPPPPPPPVAETDDIGPRSVRGNSVGSPPPPPPAAGAPPPAYAKPSRATAHVAPAKPPIGLAETPGVEDALSIVAEVCKKEAHQDAVLTAGLVPCMVAALGLPSERLKETGASCIAQLSLTTKGRVATGDSGAVVGLVSVLTPAHSSPLKYTALCALDNLCHFHIGNCEALLASGGVGLLTELINSGESTVQTQAAWLVSNLVSSGTGGLQTLTTKELVQALVTAMGSPNEALSMQCAMALHALAYDEATRTLMMESGCKPVAERMKAGGNTAIAQVAERITHLLVV